MTPAFLRNPVWLAALCASALTGQSLHAEPAHGIAMYGTPALPPDFVSLPYVNADAPKGGAIVFGEPGGFDSLNPFVLKGTAPWGLSIHVFETLLGRSLDEPFTLYGLLAESVETPDDRSWVEFTLHPDAQFSDGSPVTVDDVIWSHEVLGTEGHPRYHSVHAQVDRVEQTGPRSLRFTFNTDNRELPLLLGLRPVLQKAQWQGKAFGESGLATVPIGSGAYRIADFDPGRSITFTRNPDYWGADLPLMRGQANLDTIRYEYFGDGDIVFEAFKAGEINTFREANAARWASQYDFPRVTSGDVVKSEIPHARPSGIAGYVMNTRRPAFADWRVRDAMIHAFNFAFISEAVTGGDQPRITSYFANSELAMQPGPAEGLERALLEPFADSLPPDALDAYSLPEGDGSERNRANIGRAFDLMAEAGWTVQDGVMRDAQGRAFSFDVVLNQGATESRTVFDYYAAALNRMGITPRITVVDSAQYQERTNNYDFDMAYFTRALSLSPGNEQRLYWSSAMADEPGARNWMGMKSPAADAMIETLLASDTREEFTSAVRALDRVLTTGRYVVPLWFTDHARIAHVKELRYPETLPVYGDWPGFQPETWWWEP